MVRISVDSNAQIRTLTKLVHRISTGVLFTVWRSARVYSDARWCHRPIARLRLSDVQGREDCQHCHGQGALSGRQDCTEEQ